MGISCAHLYKLLSHCHYLVTFMDAKSLQSSLFATLWTVADNSQAPWCMGFSRQQYWSGLLCPPPGDLPNPGIEPASPVASALQADASPLSRGGSHAGTHMLANRGVEEYSLGLGPWFSAVFLNDILCVPFHKRRGMAGYRPSKAIYSLKRNCVF